MSEYFARRYPNINRFVFKRGWIEIGADEYSNLEGSLEIEDFRQPDPRLSLLKAKLK